MGFLLAALVGAQIAIDITVLWVVFKLGQHEVAIKHEKDK